MTIACATQPIDVLLVEDNPGDIRLMREAFRSGNLPVRVSVAIDGVEAIDFLRRKGYYANEPRPELILLDMNLPRKNGAEVLAEIKNDPELKSIPVVVITTSSAPQDIEQAYSLHANCYITKPLGLSDFMDVVHLIEDFWLTKTTPRPEVA